MKKLVYLFGLFLLIAGLAACSSDYDDPPEQPGSHQNETPTDSIGVNNDTTEIDSTAYTVISTVPVSEEMKAFFDEEFAVPENPLEESALYIGKFKLNHPEEFTTYNIIDSQESFESMYIGNKVLPTIDFDKYNLVYGRYLLGIDETVDFIDIQVSSKGNRIVLHTTCTYANDYNMAFSSDNSIIYYSGIEGRLKGFWGIFPKNLPSISGIIAERNDIWRIQPVEVSNTIKDFLDKALPNNNGISSFYFPGINDKEVRVINSQQELEEAYIGEIALPAIDFNENTLIIGKAYMPGMSYQVISMEIHEYRDFRVLHVFTDNPSSLYWMAYNMYFWGVFPKFEDDIDRVMIKQQ